MQNELKRVGLIFTQEGAVDFKKTLQDINLEMNKNYNQFKLTQAQWDNSTKSTEKLRAEQEYLKNAYEIQADKVSTLKMQLSDLENSENKNTTAIKKKRNELTNAEIKLKNYGDQLKDVESKLNSFGIKAEEVGKKVEKSGKNIEQAGKKVSAFSIATGTALIASAKGGIEFESAFAGVEKTVDGTTEQMTELKQGIRDMAKEIPSSTTEISAVAEAAGQLGIKTENILSFSKAMIDLGNSTNLTADEAASQLAKFANIMQMSQSDFDRLGSSIVDLGNNFATTEADIVEMAMRLAGAGKQVGLSEGQVLGLATALSSVGIEAEMGGSAISKAMVKMQNAVEQGGAKLNIVLKKTGKSLKELELMSANDSMGFKSLSQSIGMTSTELKQLITAGTNLEDFAKVSGMTTEQFKKAWKEDAAGALSAFIKGLGDAENKGESAITMLSEMGLTEVRLRDSLLRAANAGTLFNDAIETGTKAWEDNTALTNEANKRYETLESQLKMTVNKFKDLAIIFGDKLMPQISKVNDKIGDLTNWFSNLSEEEVDNIVKIGLLVTATGPLLTILGKITTTIGGGIKALGTFSQALEVMKGKSISTDESVNKLSKAMSGIASPAGAAVIAVSSYAIAVEVLQSKIDKELESTKNLISEVENSTKARQESLNVITSEQDANIAQISNTQRLREELSKLVYENGKVKEGYESRVQFILNELNGALGTEYQLNDNIIQSYENMQKSIDDLILKKKAQIILEANESKYKEAIENKTKAYEDYIKTQKEAEDVLKEYNKLLEASKNGFIGSNYSLAEGSLKLKEYGEKLNELNTSLGEQDIQLQEYNNAITTYETNSQLMLEGGVENYKKIEASIGTTVSNITTKTNEELTKQIENQIITNEKAKELYAIEAKYNKDAKNSIYATNIEAGEKELALLTEQLIARTSTTEDLSQDEINAWKKIATNSYNVYYDKVSLLPSELRTKIEEMTGVIITKTPELERETQEMSQSIVDKIKDSDEFRREAINNLNAYLNGLSDDELRRFLQEAGTQDVNKVIQGIRNGNLAENEGQKILENLNSGLKNKSWTDSLFNTARSLASKISGLLTIKANVNGNTSALPGHKLGLNYVPKDNYVARLHKGERVLTAEENKAYTAAEEVAERRDASLFVPESIDYNKMAKAMLTALTGCKLSLDEDGFAKIIKDEIYKVV